MPGCLRKAYRLTYKDQQQKTRTVYVRRQQLPKIRTMIANYARVRQIIEQLVEANIEVFKVEAAR
jgi:collagenase-like PrtC family protease